MSDDAATLHRLADNAYQRLLPQTGGLSEAPARCELVGVSLCGLTVSASMTSWRCLSETTDASPEHPGSSALLVKATLGPQSRGRVA